MNILAWSKNLTQDRAAEFGAKLSDLDDLLRFCDVISIHLLLSRRTRGLIGHRELSLMKKNGIFGQYF